MSLLKRLKELMRSVDGDIFIDGPHEVLRRKQDRKREIEERQKEEDERNERYKQLDRDLE